MPARSLQAIVIAGASLAGLRTAQAVRAEGHRGALIIVGDESHRPYNRPPLSKDLLAGVTRPANCALEHDDLAADWVLGHRIVALDRRHHAIELEDGTHIPFERLIIATGARARAWPGSNATLDGVLTLRTIDDALELAGRLRRSSRAAVIGAGFLGCEVAASARQLGVGVLMVEPAPTPMATLGAAVGNWCAGIHRDHGVDLRTETHVTRLLGDDRLEAVELSDGSTHECDIAIVALGAIPNGEWLQGTDLALPNGSLATDATLSAPLDDCILGAGDIVTFPHHLLDGEELRIEHWSNAVEQGTLAGHNALRDPADRQPLQTTPAFWSDQYEHRIQAVGFPARAQETRLLEGSITEHRYVAAGFDHGRLISAVCVNTPSRVRRYRRAISARGESVRAGSAGP